MPLRLRRLVLTDMAESTLRATSIPGKDVKLEVLSENPAVLETPHALLVEHAVTPVSNLFVRNVQRLPAGVTTEPLALKGWPLELVGLIDRPVQLAGEELLGMKQVECEMVLQCSGNGRARFDEMFPVPGVSWSHGGVANVRFAGVPLSALLEKRDVKISRESTFVTAEGKDFMQQLEAQEFEHSLPLADCLEKSILALELNGEPLPAIHGGPVRLVTPGYYGAMQIKWLQRLRFESTESTNFYHAVEYRVPKARVRHGEKFSFTLENSVPTWKLRISSLILDPESGAVLTAGDHTLRGVAFNDGDAPIESVLVSFDCGKSWRSATLQPSRSRYAWRRWTIQTSLAPGTHEIWSRAIDALGRAQPIDASIYWNPNGYQWNGACRIEVRAI
jgi:sulfite oxidase